MTEIFTAKRVEDAKKMAVEHFGVSEDQIVFRILEEPKKGFLGFGKKGEAKIEAIYEPPVAAAAEAEKAEPAAPNKQPKYRSRRQSPQHRRQKSRSGNC